MKTNHFFEAFKKELGGVSLEVRGEEIGRVVSVGDGILQIEGLPNVFFSEKILIEPLGARFDVKPAPAVVMNLEEYTAGAVLLGLENNVKEGDIVKRTGKVLSVPAGEALLGRVINPLGEPLDGKGSINREKLVNLPIERPAPSVVDRDRISAPFHTGIKIIDGLIPIGRGQRELILGDRQIGKTAIAASVILNQLNEPKENRPICVYVAIGQRQSKIVSLRRKLEKEGAMDYTIIVAASASQPAPLWFIAPYSGTSIAEYFSDKGKDSLVIYDDLTRHAWSWRQISLLLRRPSGREAYPGDVFYLHSRLLERAAKLNEQKGGGSLTALPIVETQLGDIASFIPTNIISITDGQIYLETDLFNRGQRPAVNIGLSVSRVGSSAQTKAIKKTAQKLKLELAQYQELALFTQFSQDVDAATKKRIERGERLMELLKQSEDEQIPFEEQACVFYAGACGYFDGVPIDRVRDFELKLRETLKDKYPEILEEVRSSTDFAETAELGLKKVIEELCRQNSK